MVTASNICARIPHFQLVDIAQSQVGPIPVHALFDMRMVWHNIHIARHVADCRRSGLIRPVGEIQCAQDPDNVPPRSRLFMVVPKTAEGRAIEVGSIQALPLHLCYYLHSGSCNQADSTLEGCIASCIGWQRKS